MGRGLAEYLCVMGGGAFCEVRDCVVPGAM